MFNETHLSSTNNGIPLIFIKSLNVQAYPCGRRRSELVPKDTNNDGIITESESYHIPFDPEARLNTEANNIKHSGLNGFTQTYLNDWDTSEKVLSLVLGGYLFNIKLDQNYERFLNFGASLLNALKNFDKDFDTNAVTRIYANIRIEETPLFVGFTSYNTSVLRDQYSSDTAQTTLDLLNTTARNANTLSETQDTGNYYFSGLSLSVRPLTETINPEKPLTEQEETKSERLIYNPTTKALYQRVISLCILEKNSNGNWQLHQPALLPSIKHGETEDSIKVKELSTNKLDLEVTDNEGTTSSIGVPALNVVETSEGSGIYQLQFSFGK